MAKKILITGGAGFLGSFVVKLLLKANYSVTVLKRTSTNTDRLNNLKVDYFDLDQGDLASFFIKNKVDFIIHTATSYGRKGESYDQVKNSNYDLPLKLLNLALDNGSECFINSDTFFELDPNPDQKDRSYIQTKKDFLSEAKKMVASNNGKTKFVNLRIEHVYGPNDNPTKFVPFLVKILKENRRIDFTPGLNQRDFVYVDDVAESFLSVIKNLDHLSRYEEFGIGTGQTYTIKEFSEEFQKLLGGNDLINWATKPYPIGDNMFSKANLSNNYKINWQAKISLEVGVKKTVDFYNEN